MKGQIMDIQTEIYKLIRSNKLTAEEIFSFFTEQPEIRKTESEIYETISNIIKEGKILLVKEKQESILKPANLLKEEENEWGQISREKSKGWAKNNICLGDIFANARATYNIILKKIEDEKHNSFNRIFETLIDPMEVLVEGKKCIMFSSNDYLGLSKHPEVIESCKKALEKYGNGTGGSRIMTGTTPVHRELEKAIAAFKNEEDAIVFSSGFLTNLALTSMVGKDCVILFDNLDHASIIDGIKLSGAIPLRFKHNDMDDLAAKLEAVKDKENKLIFVEGIYSMDGDIAKVDKIALLAEKYNAYLAVDEAHSSGTLGETGRGVEEYFGLGRNKIDFKMGTLSKAIGAEGGFISAKKKIVETLKYSARQFLFSTSLPASIMAGALKAMELLRSNPSMIKKLKSNYQRVRNEAQKMGYNTGRSETQIIPLIIKDDKKTHQLQWELRENGIFINAITYPGVPPKQARLRTSISAAHSDKQIDCLLDKLYKYGKKLSII